MCIRDSLYSGALFPRRAGAGGRLSAAGAQCAVHIRGAGFAAETVCHPHAPACAAGNAAGDVPGHCPAPRYGGKAGQAGMGAAVLRYAEQDGSDYGYAHAFECAHAVPSALQMLYRHGAGQPGWHLPQH